MQASIENYVAHRPPALLLDKLLEAQESSIRCEVTITEDSFLCDGGKVPAYAAIEYIAQSIACYAGVGAADKGAPAKLGFLLGVRKFKSKRPYFKVGDTLVIESSLVFNEENIGSFNGKVSINSEEVVTALLTTYEPTESHLSQLKESLNV